MKSDNVMRHFTDDNAKKFMMDYLEKDEGFSLESIQYSSTYSSSVRDTCGGCTMGDGQDCWLPKHYVDKFLVVCKKECATACYTRYSTLHMGWSGGGNCSNPLGDDMEVCHYKYEEHH